VEVFGLIWLADGARPGDPGLAEFSVVAITLVMVSLIMAPALYLFFPLLMSEFEGAVSRAAQTAAAEEIAA
jgi:hypothetical protein